MACIIRFGHLRATRYYEGSRMIEGNNDINNSSICQKSDTLVTRGLEGQSKSSGNTPVRTRSDDGIAWHHQEYWNNYMRMFSLKFHFWRMPCNSCFPDDAALP